MAAETDALRGKVQRILADRFGSVQVDNDGDFTLRYNSARAFASVKSWGEDRTLVNLFSILLADVPKSPSLHEYVAYHSDDFIFGHLGLVDRGETCNLMISHMLLGDYLDEEELLSALVSLLSTADQLDDELQKQFGGVRFHEDG